VDSYNLDGIQILSTDLTELRSYFLNSLVNSGKPQLIVTFNLEHYRNSAINSDFYSVCRNADMVLPDGVSITSLIKLKYKKSVLRITGNDIFKLILGISNEIPLKIAFVGSTDKVIEQLKNKIRIEYHHCIISAAISPSYYFENKEEENNKVLQQLVIAKPDVLFLALFLEHGLIGDSSGLGGYVEGAIELVEAAVHVLQLVLAASQHVGAPGRDQIADKRQNNGLRRRVFEKSFEIIHGRVRGSYWQRVYRSLSPSELCRSA